MLDKVDISVCCMTYNHRNTIAQALDSMLAQKTQYSFEIIVHDDASTDGTAEIVKEYAKDKRIKPILQKSNQYYRCNIAKEYINPEMSGRYVAICEGDDFWTDCNKLEKQVRYMEEHPECSMTFHAVNRETPEGTHEYHPQKTDGKTAIKDIILGGGMYCPTVSIVVRRDVADDWPRFRDMADVYDYPLQILAALRGEIYYFDDVMGTYRYQSAGSWSQKETEGFNHDHMETEKQWLNELNEYTGHNYNDIICLRLSKYFLYYYLIYKDGLAEKNLLSVLPELSGRSKMLISCVYWVAKYGGNRLRKSIVSLYRTSKYR
ncbi:MAG: glycosyltransferase [Oscillospiraceae bacterium]|nr:glycosyltransferase [Oscillospiraceae bacterium]